MPTTAIQAIDTHAHFGLATYPDNELIREFTSAEPAVVVERARRSNIRLTVVSPLKALWPRFHGEPEIGNQQAAQAVAQTPNLLHWVVVDPLKPATYDQAAQMLQTPKCVGMKIHPEEHGYHIKDHGRAIFEFAARQQALVMTHSGQENSMPEDFVPFADDFPQVNLILAHLGCTCDGDPTHQVRALQTARHDNLYIDTSSVQNILPNLLEWAVAQVTAERLLFGTDSPLYFLPMQRVRIDAADLTDQQKRLILHDNAARLLGPAAAQ